VGRPLSALFDSKGEPRVLSAIGQVAADP